MGGVVDAVGVAVFEGKEYGFVDRKSYVFNSSRVSVAAIALADNIQYHSAFSDINFTLSYISSKFCSF